MAEQRQLFGKLGGRQAPQKNPLLEIGQGRLHDVQWLVEFVCHSCSHSPDTGQLLGLTQSFQRGVTVGDVDQHADGLEPAL